MTLWPIWWAALAIKIALLPFLPITPDEAYYMAWARHPALSYLDHPPYIAWIMAAGLPFWKTALTVRWPGVVLNHLTFIPWIGILRRLKFSQTAQVYWLLLILFGPLTGLGAFIITPDTPLLFFWSAAMWAVLWTRDNPTMARWSVLGLFMGLGFLSKYTMVLFLPAAFLWIIWEDQWGYLVNPGLWISLMIALFLFLPVVLWNMQNGMASFLFQGRHGLAAQGFHPSWTLEYLSAQLGLLNPLAAIVALWVVVKKYPQQKFLTVFGIFPLLFFFTTSFKGRVEANWPVCAYPSIMALAAYSLDDKIMSRKAKPVLKWAIAVAAVVLTGLLSHIIHPWLPVPADKDHSTITREWLPDIPEVKDLHPLYARSYQMAAFLSYYRPKDQEVFKLAGLDRQDFYDFLKESRPTEPGYLILGEKEILPTKLQSSYVLSNPRNLPGHLIVYALSLRPPESLQ